MPVSTETAQRLWEDDRVLPTVKLQDLLAVAVGARKAALIPVPAALPDEAELGKEIDRRYYAAMGEDAADDVVGRALRRSLRKLRTRFTSEMAFKRSLMNRIFVDIVGSAASYRALRSWVRDLGLRGEVEECRPTVHELFVTSNADGVLEVREIGRLRRDLRAQLIREGRASRNVLPEDGMPEFGLRVGRLLDYPDCCINRYTFDRTSVVLSAEERASQQLSDALSVNAYVYFARDFIPCMPDCAEAAARGRSIHQGLEEVSPVVGEAYRELLEANREHVRHYPEMIKEHIRQLKERSKQS